MPNYVTFHPKPKSMPFSKLHDRPDPPDNRRVKEWGFFECHPLTLWVYASVIAIILMSICFVIGCKEKQEPTVIEQREAAAEKVGFELLELKSDELIIIKNGEQNVQKIYRIPADSLQHWADSLYGN
jgi:hypothetical protein